MVNIGSKCCGCTACSNICPQKCIKMEMNDEGFIYPVCETLKCVDCGLCEQVCPALNFKVSVNAIKKGYIFQNKDHSVLKESTSGGFFTALAKYVISNGGVVFGAVYAQDFSVHHAAVECEEELYKFRNSKYTQSNAEQTFCECKQYLLKGRMVLYSGTPCLIAGLKMYLGKKYENLIMCDFACRGVPSPGLFRCYVDWVGGADKIISILFREKYKGYYPSFMSVYFKDGKIKRRDKHEDPMLSFFFNDLCSRESCYHCHFKSIDRVTDFTMFDSWHGWIHNRIFGNKGTTAVIVRNKRADAIMQLLINENLCISVDYKELIKEDGCMVTNSVNKNAKREDFFKDMLQLSFDELIKKYNKKTLKRKFIIKIKMVLVKVGVFGKIMQYMIK